MINQENIIMSDMVLDIQTLPEMIFSKISAEKVRIHEENGSLILTPIIEKKQNFDVLFGMFSDGRISTEEYMKEKQIEKELEN
jgi:virulence-associated protein VagC